MKLLILLISIDCDDTYLSAVTQASTDAYLPATQTSDITDDTCLASATQVSDDTSTNDEPTQ